MSNEVGHTMGDYNWASWVGNTLSPVTIFGVVVGWFPTVAVILAILWYFIQFYEWRGTQNWMGNRRVRKIARLRIEIARLEAIELLHNPIDRSAIRHAQKNAEAILEAARTQARWLIEEAREQPHTTANPVAPDENA